MSDENALDQPEENKSNEKSNLPIPSKSELEILKNIEELREELEYTKSEVEVLKREKKQNKDKSLLGIVLQIVRTLISIGGLMGLMQYFYLSYTNFQATSEGTDSMISVPILAPIIGGVLLLSLLASLTYDKVKNDQLEVEQQKDEQTIKRIEKKLNDLSKNK